MVISSHCTYSLQSGPLHFVAVSWTKVVFYLADTQSSKYSLQQALLSDNSVHWIQSRWKAIKPLYKTLSCWFYNPLILHPNLHLNAVELSLCDRRRFSAPLDSWVWLVHQRSLPPSISPFFFFSLEVVPIIDSWWCLKYFSHYTAFLITCFIQATITEYMMIPVSDDGESPLILLWVNWNSALKHLDVLR